MEPLVAIAFLLELANSTIRWITDAKKSKSGKSEEIAEYISKISESLTNYGESLSNDNDSGRRNALRNRYYLESSIANLVYLIDDNSIEFPNHEMIDRLKKIKVHDGELVPEVSAILVDGNGMSNEKKKQLIEEIYKAAGEFKAASDLVKANA